ncbi:galactose mutarotase-like domain-containing protein [Aspergillus ambiguus]|uniref:aldose epimerase family protein n=1 Tax=Aspergillus ambiguus TaxID=176160 RepID=UPI003CCE2633
MPVKFTSRGAIIQELTVAGHNIVLGFDRKEGYDTLNPWFGATIGRVANRIRDGIIQSLNGQSYELEKNNAPNALHGGSRGWGRRDFEGPTLLQRNGRDTLLYTYTSPHRDGGYPGTVEVRVFYAVDEPAQSTADAPTVVDIEFEVELVGPEAECDETVVNVTNHTYFNLSGAPTIADTQAQLFTQHYLPLDHTGIPHGHIAPYPQPVTDPFAIGPGPDYPVFDDVFVMDHTPDDIQAIPLDTRARPLRPLAQFRHSGRHLQVLSTEPAFQFYTGGGTNVPAVGNTPARGPFSGFCIEPSRFVNAVNEPEWRHMVVLKRGGVYGSRVQYRVWSEQ